MQGSDDIKCKYIGCENKRSKLNRACYICLAKYVNKEKPPSIPRVLKAKYRKPCKFIVSAHLLKSESTSDKSIMISHYKKYDEQFFYENLNWDKNYDDGFKTYKRKEQDTVGKLNFPYNPNK
jgi:hypothetical protein